MSLTPTQLPPSAKAADRATPTCENRTAPSVREDNSCVKAQSQVLCVLSVTLNTSNEAGSLGPFYSQEQGQSDPRGHAGPLYKANSMGGVQPSKHNTLNCHGLIHSSPQRSSQYTTHNQELPTNGINAENNRSPNASFFLSINYAHIPSKYLVSCLSAPAITNLTLTHHTIQISRVSHHQPFRFTPPTQWSSIFPNVLLSSVPTLKSSQDSDRARTPTLKSVSSRCSSKSDLALFQ